MYSLMVIQECSYLCKHNQWLSIYISLCISIAAQCAVHILNTSQSVIAGPECRQVTCLGSSISATYDVCVKIHRNLQIEKAFLSSHVRSDNALKSDKSAPEYRGELG